MRRTPIVVTATVAGLAGVLAFHTTPSRLSLGALPAPSGASPPAPHTTAPPTARPGGSSSPPKRGSTAGATRIVDGPAVNYNFGVLSVSVTVTGNQNRQGRHRIH